MRLFIATIIAILILWKVSNSIPKAPVGEFISYHKAFEEAHKMQAYHYAEELFLDAIYLSIDAYEKLQYENEQCFIFRDYSELKNVILLATSIAEEAKEEAMKNKNQQNNNLTEKKYKL